MIEHTYNLSQYGIVHGRKLYMFKRPELRGRQKYAAPMPAGIKWYPSKAQALEAKKEYDKPIVRH